MHTDNNVIPAILAASSIIVVAIFTYLRRLKGERYLNFWKAGWGLLALHYAAISLSNAAAPGDLSWFAQEIFLSAAALVFLSASLEYVQKPPLSAATVVASAVIILWTMAFRFHVFPVAPEFAVLAVFFLSAAIYWKHNRLEGTRFDSFLGTAFFVLGLLPAGELYTASPLSSSAHMLSVLLCAALMFSASLMVLAAYERQNSQIERNVLALANLNLAASGLQSGESDRVLAQALERVLTVVEFPAGAILLRQPTVRNKKLTIASGVPEPLLAELEDDALRDYLVQLTTRLGGLAVFLDLERDASWSALEREEMFSRFRRTVVSHGLQTVLAIGLQCGEEKGGVLLLASPDRRELSASEFHLLTALGQQMGLAVDNSGLMQNAWRQSEELRLLNEIGQALSSTLEPDALLEKIYSEMQRLFENADFYIAIVDEAQQQLYFELDVIDGARQPKRSRPLGNHLSEYIIQTKQPLLICENFDEESRKLGVQPFKNSPSFCGVPLVVNDRAFGVMTVRSQQEHKFDRDHLKILGVLANHAAIAIENARLLRGEQTRARHLSLLNNISRHAIAMHDPAEMLALMANQLERGLTFDHMGIGLIDAGSKEVVIRAEAGRRRGAVERRLQFGDSLIGHVASTGQMLSLREMTDSDARLVLEDSVASIALPLLFGEQIQGVLYVEMDKTYEFSDEEVQTLLTLADLISGALHHAQTLQIAREQAVTDGLTGVKTHRYLLEALSAEWKRSTRANRAFCVLLADLDRFKFVNDLFGHLDGDLVLKRVARILEQNCRASDVIARYGGDEFVILMPESDLEHSRHVAEKLRACIFGDSLLRSKNVTASIGVAAFPADGATPQELIQIADSSMYLSKHQGGNTVSTTGRLDAEEARQWKRDVLEAYLGVTLKRLFSTGPEAFAEIHRRLEQFSQSLPASEAAQRADGQKSSPMALPGPVMETVTSLALAIDAKDPYTQGHSPKVATYSALIAEHLGLPELQIEQVRLGGMLHDLGKVGIPEAILNKSGPLNPEEWETMKEHVRFGDKLLEPIRTLAEIRAMVLHHHEMFDGSGYPEGRSGTDIPLGARIIAIADAYDTITSDRTYKKARPAQAALAEIGRCAGAQFDPDLVSIFITAMQHLSTPVVTGSRASGSAS